MCVIDFEQQSSFVGGAYGDISDPYTWRIIPWCTSGVIPTATIWAVQTGLFIKMEYL